MFLRYFFYLLILLAIKALVMVFVIIHSGIGLGPDEAQYWTWSHMLDWGYYSKPPGIAWQIWLGTRLFGDTELGVRFFSLVIGTLIPLSVFALGKNCRLSPQACFWAAAAMAFSPIGMFASLLAITDGGMVLFWGVASAYLAGKIEKQEMPNYYLLGAWIFAGALFKWPIYWFWPIVFGAWMRWRWLASWHIIGGMIISLVALLPSVYWNATHEWATFRHVFATMKGGNGLSKGGALVNGNALEFIGAQAGLVSPILFILLLMAFWTIFRNKKTVPAGVLFCGIVSIVILGLSTAVSLRMKMQGNWAIFAYPTAFVALSWYACDKVTWGKGWVIGGVGFSLAACLLALSIPFMQSHPVLSSLKIPYRLSPFRHNVGWDHLSYVLMEAGYNPKRDFLFGDKYQMASILSFYGPGQKRAYFLNLQGIRKNQFSYWPEMFEEQKHRRGFFVAVENASQLNLSYVETYFNRLKPFFNHVNLLGIEPIFWSYGQSAKVALIFECQDYNGEMPVNPELY